MSTYQTYDFIKDINFHIKNKVIIDMKSKSKIFKSFLFKLKLFQLNDKIKRSHPLFNELYFLFILNNTLYIAKKFDNEPLNFDYIEILNGIKTIRKMKLKKLFQE
jgi:hypothetical protein